jgi:prepilin-type N-terminal cleavage/methylation domain-containing protein
MEVSERRRRPSFASAAPRAGSRGRLRGGFTLVELTIVLLVLGILAGIAAPKFLRVSDEAAFQGAARCVRTILDAAERYHAENGSFPSEADPGELPPELAAALPARLFSSDTPLGGKFDWHGSASGMDCIGVSIEFSEFSDALLKRWSQMDERFDDGDLNSGAIFMSSVQNNHLMFKLADHD